jgi:hypothetical protein
MKNIHVLTTEKPSRFFKDDLGYYFSFETLQRSNFINQHIYITSDEEIKEGDWYYLPRTNSVHKCIEATELNLERRLGVAKIILTTDQDLIEDGVQAIDDEFLEWFVKNPSCEYIQTTELSLFNGDTGQSGHYKYEIIIPQVEPKFTTGHQFLEKADKVIVIHRPKQEQKQHLIDLMRLDEEQQTFTKPDNVDGQWLSPVPTERAWQEEKLVEIFGHYPTASPKWQYMNGLIQNSLDAKQMYSEQELRNAMNWMMTQYFEFYEQPTTGRVNHYIQTIKQQEE